jgi:hypothetical protein
MRHDCKLHNHQNGCHCAYGVQIVAVTAPDRSPLPALPDCLHDERFAQIPDWDESMLTDESRVTFAWFSVEDVMQWTSVDAAPNTGACNSCETDLPYDFDLDAYSTTCSFCKSEDQGGTVGNVIERKTEDIKAGDFYYRELFDALSGGELLQELPKVNVQRATELFEHADGHHRMASLIALGATRIPYEIYWV